jgi:hypothetical protein
MTALLSSLEAEHPNVKSVMMAALANVCPTHLLDRDVARAWEARHPEIPAKASLARGRARAAARPEEAGSPASREPEPRRLPLVDGGATGLAGGRAVR